jgi:hypothetical protein
MAAYHQLWQIERSFRMSETDLRARAVSNTSATRSKPTSASPSPSAVTQTIHRIEYQKLPQTLPLPQHRRPNADHSLHAGTPLDDAKRAALSESSAPATEDSFTPY